jgi:hypothetical protein
MVTLTTGIIFFPFTCMHFWVWGILRMWSGCAPTAYEVVHDCRNVEKHCCRGIAIVRTFGQKLGWIDISLTILTRN